MTDEMPTDLQVREDFRLSPQLLRPAFAQLRNTCFEEQSGDFRFDIFCDTDQHDLFSSASGAYGSRRDIFTDAGEIVANSPGALGWIERHKAPSYPVAKCLTWPQIRWYPCL